MGILRERATTAIKHDTRKVSDQTLDPEKVQVLVPNISSQDFKAQAMSATRKIAIKQIDWSLIRMPTRGPKAGQEQKD